VPAAALVLTLACGGGDAADRAGSADSAATASSRDAHTHDGAGEHSHDGAGDHTHASPDTLAAGVRLAPEGGAGWTGSATFLAVGDSVRVLVSVEGSEAGARHRAELLAGDCGSPGARLATLTPVAIGSSGAGSSETTLPAAGLGGHAHGALRVMEANGGSPACAPVHLGAEHGHG
jgi:hypothetical protein